MRGRLDVLARLLVGALTEAEAARALGVSVEEVERLRREVASEDAALVPVAVDLPARRFELLDLTGATYREPFFQETIERARRERPGSLDVEIDSESFVRAAERYSRPPDGLIFHAGRCGSTLLANMLTASNRYLVVKEPDLVSDLIAGWLHTGDEALRGENERLLAATIRYLLGAAGEAEAAFYRVLKLAAWNVRLAGPLLRLFPATPAVFVYRSPFETVASLLFQRPAWFALIERPRSIQTRFFPAVREVPDGAALSPVALFAYAWRSACEAALAIPPDRLLTLDYCALASGAEPAICRILSHFRHPVDTTLVAPMAAARATYAKDPAGLACFDPRGKHYRPPLSSEQAEEVRSITADLWHRLKMRSRSAVGPALSSSPTQC